MKNVGIKYESVKLTEKQIKKLQTNTENFSKRDPKISLDDLADDTTQIVVPDITGQLWIIQLNKLYNEMIRIKRTAQSGIGILATGLKVYIMAKPLYGCQTACVGGGEMLFYLPFILGLQSSQIVFVFAHELYHTYQDIEFRIITDQLRRHPSSFGENVTPQNVTPYILQSWYASHHYTINCAADYEDNYILVKDGIIDENFVASRFLFDASLGRMKFEDVYEKLVNDKDKRAEKPLTPEEMKKEKNNHSSDNNEKSTGDEKENGGTNGKEGNSGEGDINRTDGENGSDENGNDGSSKNGAGSENGSGENRENKTDDGDESVENGENSFSGTDSEEGSDENGNDGSSKNGAGSEEGSDENNEKGSSNGGGSNENGETQTDDEDETDNENGSNGDDDSAKSKEGPANVKGVRKSGEGGEEELSKALADYASKSCDIKKWKGGPMSGTISEYLGSNTIGRILDSISKVLSDKSMRDIEAAINKGVETIINTKKYRDHWGNRGHLWKGEVRPYNTRQTDAGKINLIYMFDNSGSMGGPLINSCITILQKLWEKYEPYISKVVAIPMRYEFKRDYHDAYIASEIKDITKIKKSVNANAGRDNIESFNTAISIINDKNVVDPSEYNVFINIGDRAWPEGKNNIDILCENIKKISARGGFSMKDMLIAINTAHDITFVDNALRAYNVKTLYIDFNK